MNQLWELLNRDGAGVTLFGVLCFFIFAGVLLRAHVDRKSPINLTDLLVEPVAGTKKLTMSRFVAFSGFLLASWVFIYAAKTGALHDSWEGIGGFLGVCLAYRGWDSYIKVGRDAAAESPNADLVTVPPAPPKPPTRKGK